MESSEPDAYPMGSERLVAQGCKDLHRAALGRRVLDAAGMRAAKDAHRVVGGAAQLVGDAATQLAGDAAIAGVGGRTASTFHFSTLYTNVIVSFATAAAGRYLAIIITYI